MASVQRDGLDDLLFSMYKKHVLKHLRTKMPPEMLSTLTMLKDGAGSSTDFEGRVSRLEYFLASMVAGGDGCAVSESSLLGLKSRLVSNFGSVLSIQVISGIVDLIAARSSKMPSLQEENENLAIDLLNLLVGSSCIKTNVTEFVTPPYMQKNVSIKSPTAPVKCVAKQDPHPKRVAMQDPHTMDAKVLFPQVISPDIELMNVVEGPSKTTKKFKKDEPDVVFIKEVGLHNRLNDMCKSSDALYNKSISMKSKVDVQGATTVENPRSPSVDIVSGYRVNVSDVGVPITVSARFPVSPREKMVYNAVCSLAKGKLANSTIVDIGGCILKYFSLGESMIGGKQVCTFVINALCRKYFLDVRYFFSGIAEVFLSESPDYTSVGKCFNRAGSVLPLPTCELLFFPVLSANHWFLFVVDLKRKFFMVLDSYYSKDDGFSVYTREKMIVGFLTAWNQFLGPTTRFSDFRAAYPHVPKQENEVDCGIFLIKFMELWGNGTRMTELFSQQDIPSIRVKISNDLVYCKHNTADINAVNDFIDLGAARA